MKKVFLLGSILTAFTFSFSSCSDDDAEAGTIPVETGQLSSGTSADNNLPNGYRIASVGSIRYIYGADGRIEGFDWEGDYVQFKEGKLNYNYDGTDTQISLNKQGLITQISESINYKDSDGYDKGDGKMKCSYNSHNQLTSMSFSVNEEFSYEGEKGKWSASMNCSLTYSGTKLTKVVADIVESEDGHKETGKRTMTFKYDENYPNPFGQYTERILEECFAEMAPDPLAYLGLLGRASSELPTSIHTEEVDTEDGETQTFTHDYTCGPYIYNEYGALSKADGHTYTYTTVNSRAVSDFPFIANQKKTHRSLLFNLHQKKVLKTH